jgi:formate hydrogenlyase subunit 3/multisubunit Na+/H+ antiporter MnhD subunit
VSTLFVLLIAGYSAGAAAALVCGTGALARWLSALGAFVGAVAGLGLAVAACIGGATFVLDVPELLGPAGGLAFRLDSLGAVFLGLTSLVAAPSALYGVTYTRTWD